MKTLLFLTVLLIGLISCSNESCDSSPLNVYLYSRDLGNNNGTESYLDVVVLDPYKNGKYTIHDLALIAKKYIDTTSHNSPVSNIFFIGKTCNKTLPNPETSSISEQRNLYVVSFGFDNGISKYAANKSPDLTDITIWKKGKPNSFSFPSQKDSSFAKYKYKVDSILNSPIPINTNQQ